MNVNIKEMIYCPFCGADLQKCFQYEQFYEENTILYCEMCDAFMERYISINFIEDTLNQ